MILICISKFKAHLFTCIKLLSTKNSNVFQILHNVKFYTDQTEGCDIELTKGKNWLNWISGNLTIRNMRNESSFP